MPNPKKRSVLSISVVLFLSAFSALNGFAQSEPYTPAKGTSVRKAILNGVRIYRQAPDELYTPKILKVQNGWAFVSADDPSEPGVDSLAFHVLLRKTGTNTWRVVDAVNATEGSDWNAEIRRIRKAFPQSPAGIFQ